MVNGGIGGQRLGQPVPEDNVITIQSDLDIAFVRTQVRDLARVQGFDAIDQARIATVVSQISRSLLPLAGSRRVILRGIERNGQRGVECVFTYVVTEANPMILTDTFSFSEKPFGTGMPNPHRLMDEFEIYPNGNAGKTLVCRKWLQGAGP
jgi:serine/threonine-protein kinase RsbT